MRIISGLLGGRTFQSPNAAGTHPMSDKIRSALFNVLGDIEGLTVLDAFTGSGAVAYEAISRGATSVVAVDDRLEPIATVRANCKALGIDRGLTIAKANVANWLRDAAPKATFDIVICDPPFDNVQPDVLELAASRVTASGIVVLSLPPAAEVPLGDDFKLLRDKTYGNARLYFYRRTAD